MAIDVDFSVSAAGLIRHEANANHYTVLELHRWLQGLADDAEAASDDIIDISRATPSERSTDQIIQLLGAYNIDDDAAEYFYGGSIKQGSGATEEIYAGLKVLGAVNDTTNSQLMIIQSNDYFPFTPSPASPFWGSQSGGGYNGNATEGILMQLMVKCRTAGVDIDKRQVRVQCRQWGDTYDFFNVTLGEGESVAAVGTTPDAQNDTAIAVVQAWAGGDIPTNVEGYQTIDLNNGAGAQPYYSQWTFNSNAAGLKSIWEWIKEISGNDSPEAADPHSMNGELFLGVTHEWAYNAGGAFTEDEIVIWGTQVSFDGEAGGTLAVGNLVRFSGGAAGTILRYEAANLTVALEDVSQTIAEDEVITEYDPADGSATGVTADADSTITDNTKEGGSGKLLATTGAATGTCWIQLVSGKPPVDTLPIYGMTSAQAAAVNGAVTPRTVPKIFLGSYTGSLIGAFGIGVDPDDLTAADSLQDLLAATQQPPNNVTFTVNGVEFGAPKDRILVGKKHDSNNDFDFDEMTLDTGAEMVTGSETVVDVGTGNVPADAPQTGVLRITLDDGRVRRQAYISHNEDDQFTITSADYLSPDDAAAGNGVMLAFIDKEAAADPETFIVKYDAARTLWVRVRNGGTSPIKTYEAQAALGDTGGSATALRIDDA
jgi:hypothetical protein